MSEATATIEETPVIEVRDLVTHYGDRKILQGVDMDVRRGEIMVIMGGSGSGKSTLLRHLIRLERKTSGSIKLLGQELDEMSEFEFYAFCRKLGVAFQGGALFSSMTVGENIMLPLREHTNLDQKTMEIMLRLKLEGSVLLRIHISARGQLLRCDLAERSGSARLDNAALEAVEGWTFLPATSSGVAIEGSLLHRVTFNLKLR